MLSAATGIPALKKRLFFPLRNNPPAEVLQIKLMRQKSIWLGIRLWLGFRLPELNKGPITAVNFVEEPDAGRIVRQRDQIHNPFIKLLYRQDHPFTPLYAIRLYGDQIVHFHAVPHHFSLMSVYYKMR